MKTDFGVIVVGAGNAALTAAIAAQDAGARVLVLEAAPREARGGNTVYAGGSFNLPHKGLKEVREFMPDLSDDEAQCMEVPVYTEDQFYSYWMNFTKGLADAELVETVVTKANEATRWLMKNGIQWAPFITYAVKSKGKIKFSGNSVLGVKDGGIGYSDTLFRRLENNGTEIRYNTRAWKLLLSDEGKVSGVVAKDETGFKSISSKAVILACGGFEANREMRARYLSTAWELARLRGTRYNTGEGLRMALEIGAQPTGQWSRCHGVLVDINAPLFPEREVGDSTSRASTTYGILVDSNGRRLVDEGEDIKLVTYAKFGEVALSQPDMMAYQIFDAKVQYLLEDRYSTSTPVTADTIEQLAADLDMPGLVDTVREYNCAVQESEFDPTHKDGKHTVGITPPKTNWAMRIEAPPFLVYPVTGAITFTYGGLKTNTRAQVLDMDDKVIPGLYAAGETMGGLFYHNYIGGGGLMAGAVFGREAGMHAAQL